MLHVYPACSKYKYHASEDADCRESARSLFTSVRTAVSFCICSVPRAVEWSCSFRFQLKHRYVVSLILHASIAEITLRAIVFIVAYSISSDDGSIINQDFCADQHLGSESCM